MDTHHDDPTDRPPSDDEPTGTDEPGGGDETATGDTDPWDEAAERFSTLGSKLKEQYRTMAGEEGPSEGDVKDAFRTLGAAFERVMDAVGSAFRDPEVRDQTKQAASSLVTALGATFEELGEELKRATKRGEHEVSDEDETDEAVVFDEWGVATSEHQDEDPAKD